MANDDIRYEGVAEGVSAEAANAAWDFIEELDLVARKVEELGQLVANARQTGDPAEWRRRLSEGRAAYAEIQDHLGQVNSAMDRMEVHAPKIPS